jgi:hypothetical protein
MTISIRRAGLLTLTLLLLSRVEASAEWQIRPFLGVSFRGNTTFVDFAGAAGRPSPNVVFGGNGAFLGNVIGIEADFGYAPGFFQSGDEGVVRKNSATTLTGNVIITLPRRLAEYTLGPYFVAGLGLMHARIENVLDVLPVNRTLPAMDIGGGVTGYLSERFGLIWDARYFRSVGGKQGSGISIDPLDASEQLSFWRASMGLVIRY